MASLNKLLVALVAVCAVLAVGHAYELPEECKDKMFCSTKPGFYDDLQQEIDEKFAPIQKKWNLQDEPKDEDEPEDEDEPIFPSKNCPYITKVLTPYMLKTNETTKVIVQSSFYKQKFRITECYMEDPGQEDSDVCFENFTGLNKGYCRTKYASIALYVYDNIKEKIERVPVSIPVCCACTIYS